MKSVFFFLLLYFISLNSKGQAISDSINKEDAQRILSYLASDELKGRVNYTKEQLLAAEFIDKKFTELGLETFPGYTNYYIPITTFSSNTETREKIKWNEKNLSENSFVLISRSLYRSTKQLSDFTIIPTAAPLPDSFLFSHWNDKRDNLIWIKSGSKDIKKLISNLLLPPGVQSSDVLLAAAADEPKSMTIMEKPKFKNAILYNVVGVLNGKSKPDEAIIFAAHYDHVDEDVRGSRGKVLNGANDNASGTTAVLMLAKYFSLRRDNERTIIFCLFAGEEMGMIGSGYFAQLVKPESIKAVIDIEMIGTSKKMGKNSFFVTGADRSDLQAILKKNITIEKVTIGKEPDPSRNIFERSDNYPFALKGIPAHTIMAGDDSDPCYHRPCDDADQIEFENMTTIIRAIAEGCRTLISGKDTPKRIKN